MFDRFRLRSGFARLSLCGLWLMTSSERPVLAGPAGSPGLVPNVTTVKDGALAAAIHRAVRGAQRRLERADCQRVLDEFADAAGRTLRTASSAQGPSPDAWLGRIIFRDGRDAATCTRAAAFTGVGSRVVFICPRWFTSVSRSEAELIVIHELLHTLGLSELPPTPHQIDQAIARRCGP